MLQFLDRCRRSLRSAYSTGPVFFFAEVASGEVRNLSSILAASGFAVDLPAPGYDVNSWMSAGRASGNSVMSQDTARNSTSLTGRHSEDRFMLKLQRDKLWPAEASKIGEIA
jgi:hypothetical protein